MNDIYLICIYYGDKYISAYCREDYDEALEIMDHIPRTFNIKLYKVNTRIKAVTEL